MATSRPRPRPQSFALRVLLVIFGLISFAFVVRYRRPDSQPQNPFITTASEPSFNPNGTVELVIAATKNSNTSWYSEFFPSWKKHVYVLDDPDAPLHIANNKGHEGTAYLSHIIDNYDSLPDYLLFLHPGRYQWHNEDPLYDGAAVLQHLRFPYVAEQGFASLRCSWELGCPAEMHPDITKVSLLQLPDDVADYREKTEAAYASAFAAMFPDQPIPPVVGAHCGAQFAVSRPQLRLRSREDYARYRAWLLDTPVPDHISGRIMEYMWHVIFSKPAVLCPHAGVCFCDKFGLCNLKCWEHACQRRYWFKFGDIPEGWPDKGSGQGGWPPKDWAQDWVYIDNANLGGG